MRKSEIHNWIKTNAFDIIGNADMPLDTDDVSQLRSYVDYVCGISDLAHRLICNIKEEGADEENDRNTI